MDNMELIRTRKSVRTFDGEPVRDADREALRAFLPTIRNHYDIYEKHSLAAAAWDVQKVDLGIALCHFMNLAGGTLSVSDPGIAAAKDMEYIATITVN